MSNTNALAAVDPKTVLQRYEAGESIAQIAQTLDVTDAGMYRFLLRTDPELWKELSSAHALAELDRAELETVEAQDKLSLARACARADHAKWKLERLLRRYFGQDQAHGSGPGVQINVNISPRTSNPVSVDAQVIESKDASTDS